MASYSLKKLRWFCWTTVEFIFPFILFLSLAAKPSANQICCISPCLLLFWICSMKFKENLATFIHLDHFENCMKDLMYWYHVVVKGHRTSQRCICSGFGPSLRSLYAYRLAALLPVNYWKETECRSVVFIPQILVFVKQLVALLRPKAHMYVQSNVQEECWQEQTETFCPNLQLLYFL